MEVGLYGKLPSHGDFLRRRVDDAFIAVWDEWLQQSIAASRTALGERWLDVYLTSPVWRFACDSGVCGPQRYAGLIVPSVDRVGRYFPLTLVWEVPEGTSPLAVAQRADGWFDQVERLILETLAEEQVDLERFDERLILLGRDLDRLSWTPAVELDLADAAGVTAGTRAQWQLALGAPPSFAALTEQLLYSRLRATHAPFTVFWTEGSAAVEPCCLLLSGLPAPNSYAALLSGQWADEGWRVVGAKTLSAPLHTDTWIGESVINFRSVGVSDTGRVRAVNQDAFIERSEIGVWCVADGMGGHAHGEVASRMICDALADLTPTATLPSMVEEIAHRLERVNGYLYRAATRTVNPVQSGSTVVVLVTRGTHSAVLWVGDSRVYRLRSGELQQLTRDHVLDEADEEDDQPTHAITRAVGGDASLAVDVAYGTVRPGDRFVLCSDGLNHEVSDDIILRHLNEADVAACTQQLVNAALQAGGSDNVTVIIVDASGPASELPA
jgi:type VI secretion system protein ImpM